MSESEKTFSFRVEGMTCASCVRLVERNLNKVPGVEYVAVNLATEKAYVAGAPGITEEVIQEAVKKAGYGYSSQKRGTDPLRERFEGAKKNMILALVFTIPLMIAMIFHMSGLHIPYFSAIELAAAGVVLFIAGRGVFKSAWIAGVHLHTNMDTLVSLGAFAAWVTALLSLIGLPILSFGSIAAMIVAFHLTGRYIEARLKQKASTEIRALMELQAETARVVESDGSFREIPIESVKPGLKLRILTGERIPLDGTVTEGKGNIDESMVTGEPVPVRKETGDELIGGSLLSTGALTIEVTKTGDDTFLSQMIKLIEEAQSSRVPIQALADRITKVFVPVVFTLACAAGLFWGLNFHNMQGVLNTLAGIFPWIQPEAGAVSTGVFAFVATLVIACPCALGLATPMALVTGSGVAAKQGLIIRSGEAIQIAKDLSVIILDKTGTITEGHPRVVETDLPEDVLRVVGNIENNSTHPLAQAVRHFTEERGLDGKIDLEDIEEISGQGIGAVYRGSRYFIGRPEDSARYTGIMNKGYTVIEVRRDSGTAGYIAISDPIKETSYKAVEAFKRRGFVPVMITGDQKPTAQAVAAMVGIDTWAAEVKPSEKVDWVRKYQKQGNTVAMVGDGINDAAALKSADVGIAIGSGTDLAIENADMVIVQGELSKVLDAITISEVTFKKIRQNLFWAFFYNLIALPLAMTGILYPAIAEAAMMFSSINVILNSIRIKKNIEKRRTLYEKNI